MIYRFAYRMEREWVTWLCDSPWGYHRKLIHARDLRWPSIVLANQRCSRTAARELSLENPFELIEGHPARLVISETSAC